MKTDNKALAIRWMEDSWNHRRHATIDELLEPHGVGYLEGGRKITGPEEFHLVRHELIGAFPDINIRIEGAVAEGEVVALRWRLLGTHTGEAMGKPTGKPLDVVGTTWFKFLNGKIVEGHDTWNQGALIKELSS